MPAVAGAGLGQDPSWALTGMTGIQVLSPSSAASQGAKTGGWMGNADGPQFQVGVPAVT